MPHFVDGESEFREIKVYEIVAEPRLLDLIPRSLWLPFSHAETVTLILQTSLDIATEV